jgi:hypothetical protein
VGRGRHEDEQGDRDDSVGTSNIAGRRGDRHVIPFIAVSSSLTMEIDMPYPSMSGSEYVIDADIKARYNFVLEYIHIFYYIYIYILIYVLLDSCASHMLYIVLFYF